MFYGITLPCADARGAAGKEGKTYSATTLQVRVTVVKFVTLVGAARRRGARKPGVGSAGAEDEAVGDGKSRIDPATRDLRILRPRKAGRDPRERCQSRGMRILGLRSTTVSHAGAAVRDGREIKGGDVSDTRHVNRRFARGALFPPQWASSRQSFSFVRPFAVCGLLDRRLACLAQARGGRQERLVLHAGSALG